MIAPDTYLWSPSAIVTYEECARKWGFKNIAKIRTPQPPSAALGTETHKQLETYLGGGQLDFTRRSGYIAAAGLQHLPDPKTPGMVLEGHFKFQSPDTGFFYHGYRDFYVPASSRPEGRPLVGDHKTTGNLSYAKKPADLWTDPQAIIYARNEDTEGDVDLRWIYYETKGGPVVKEDGSVMDHHRSKVVDLTLPRPHVIEEFAKLELTAESMRGILDESKQAGLPHGEGTPEAIAFVLSLPPTLSACKNYGGCPYRNQCQVGTSGLFGSNLKTLGDNMTQGIQGISDLLARITGAPVPVEAAPSPAVVDHGPEKGQDVFTSDFINPPPADVHAAPTTPPPPPPEEKRKRRTKAEMEAARAAEAPVPEQTPAPVQPVATGSAPETPAGGFALHVDCLPNTPYVDAVHTLNVAKQAVCEKTGKPDYRLVDYGHGPGLLAMAMEDLVDQGSLKGDVFISTQLQETQAVLEVLTRRATRVVRSVVR